MELAVLLVNWLMAGYQIVIVDVMPEDARRRLNSLAKVAEAKFGCAFNCGTIAHPSGGTITISTAAALTRGDLRHTGVDIVAIAPQLIADGGAVLEALRQLEPANPILQEAELVALPDRFRLHS